MKSQNLLPAIYYDESRDFSFISRLQDICFNYMKTAADAVKTSAADPNAQGMILELTANTFRFQPKHRYNTSELIAILSIFQELLRKKGSKEAIEEAINALISTQHVSEKLAEVQITHDSSDYLKLIIDIPAIITDTTLLEDLFDYILPAGVLYTFNKVSDSSAVETALQATNAPGTTGYGYAFKTDRDLGTIDTQFDHSNNHDIHEDYLAVVVTE